MLFYFIAALIAVADQILKIIVHQHMFLNQSIPLIGEVVKLTYVRNTGVAFSLFVGFSPYLAIVGTLVVGLVIYFHYRLTFYNYLVQIGLAFILGGSLGNLIDRFARGYVIDYMDITIWPVFNLADVMINIGVILLAYKLFEEEEKNVSDSD
jgi:signal peptidase II